MEANKVTLQKQNVIKLATAAFFTFLMVSFVSSVNVSISEISNPEKFAFFVAEALGTSIIPFVIFYLCFFRNTGKNIVQISFLVVLLATIFGSLIKINSKHEYTTLKTIYMNTKVELPAMIDSETRLDSIILNENVITYHYTLVNLNKSQSQYLDFQSLNNNFKNRMCSTQLLRKALNEGGAFSTSYYGVDGEFFNSFSVSEKSCSR